MPKFLPYSRQLISDDDIQAVLDVLKSDFLTQGPKVGELEGVVCAEFNSKYAVGVNSATSGLHISCLALGLSAGDLMWTTPNSFVASANCGLYCNAQVDFVDIDIKTGNLCPDLLEQKLKYAEQSRRLPKVIVSVHYAGQPTNQEKIWELAKRFDIRIIEDASHSIGASRHDEKVGSCRWSDVTVFSFHPVKAVTTAEGGIATTNDEAVYQKMLLYRGHGITKQKSLYVLGNDQPWHYEQQSLGFNYRLSDVHAALGISQLKRLHDFISIRTEIAERYSKLLKGLPLEHLSVYPENKSAWHLYVVKLGDEYLHHSKQELFNRFMKNNIGVNVHYIPIHLQPYYQQLGFKRGYLSNAEKFFDQALSLPIHPSMVESDQSRVVEVLEQFL